MARNETLSDMEFSFDFFFLTCNAWVHYTNRVIPN